MEFGSPGADLHRSEVHVHHTGGLSDQNSNLSSSRPDTFITSGYILTMYADTIQPFEGKASFTIQFASQLCISEVP